MRWAAAGLLVSDDRAKSLLVHARLAQLDAFCPQRPEIKSQHRESDSAGETKWSPRPFSFDQAPVSLTE
jgi:hypothetical protein